MPSCWPFTFAHAAWKVRKDWKAAGKAGDDLRNTDNPVDAAIHFGKGLEHGRNTMRSARKVGDELDKRQKRKEEKKEKRRKPRNDRIHEEEHHEGMKQRSSRKRGSQRHSERDQLPKRPEHKLHREGADADRPRRRKRTSKKHRGQGNNEGGASQDTARHHSGQNPHRRHGHSERSRHKHKSAGYVEHRESHRIPSSSRRHKRRRDPNERSGEGRRRNDHEDVPVEYEEYGIQPQYFQEDGPEERSRYEDPSSRASRSHRSHRSGKPYQARVSNARTDEV